jgi:hypothetical protein
MSSPTLPPRKSTFHLAIPRPAFQREYTASPSLWPAFTQKTHHGFIALHTSTPGQTPESHEHHSAASSNDYFSARRNSSILSPDPVPYEAHGFIPPCSVAAVGEYAKDYLSVLHTQVTAPVESSFESFESPVSKTANISETASAPTPRFAGYRHTSHLPPSQLAQPTGSPVHERDMMPSLEKLCNPEGKGSPVLRGGGGGGGYGHYFYEKEQEGCEEKCEETAYPETLHLNDPTSKVIASGKSNQTSAIHQLPRATSMTEEIVQDADGSAETQYPIRNDEDHVRSPEGNRRKKESVGATRQFPSTDEDIAKLLREIAVVFPNASARFVSSEAHVNNADEEGDASSMDSDMGAVEEELSPRQSRLDDSVYRDDTSARNRSLPVLDIESISPETTMDDPEPGKILPKPLSPRPSSTSSSTRIRKKKRPYKPLSSINSNSGGLFDIAQRSTAREFALCRSGLKVDIVNATTREVYVRKVSIRMLWHFCGGLVLDQLADEDRVDILKIPAEEAGKSGIARVVRYMRRACASPIVRPAGELRVPSFAAGLETIRACRVFGLEADAERIERLMIKSWMRSEEWYMTDEHVELIWEGYHGLLRETVLGDAIVWSVLNEVQSGTHPLAEEIRWMLDQEEYESLKERVYEENSGNRKRWRHESRTQYLERCRVEREYGQRREEELTGHLRQEELRCFSPDVERTDILERHRSNATFAGLLDEETSEPDVPVLPASQTSSLPRRSSNSRAGTDTPRPISLEEMDPWTEVSPTIARASPVPSNEHLGLSDLWSQDTGHELRRRADEVPASPKQKLSLLRRLEARIDR